MLSGGRVVDAENRTKLLLPASIWLVRLAGKMTLCCSLGIDALCIKTCFLSHASNPLLTTEAWGQDGWILTSFLLMFVLMPEINSVLVHIHTKYPDLSNRNLRGWSNRTVRQIESEITANSLPFLRGFCWALKPRTEMSEMSETIALD